MNIELSHEEAEILTDLLERAIKMLPVEIHHTRNNEFKEFLKNREKAVEKLHARIKESAA